LWTSRRKCYPESQQRRYETILKPVKNRLLAPGFTDMAHGPQARRQRKPTNNLREKARKTRSAQRKMSVDFAAAEIGDHDRFTQTARENQHDFPSLSRLGSIPDRHFLYRVGLDPPSERSQVHMVSAACLSLPWQGWIAHAAQATACEIVHDS
jgi:hypothetical protein